MPRVGMWLVSGFTSTCMGLWHRQRLETYGVLWNFTNRLVCWQRYQPMLVRGSTWRMWLVMCM